MKRHHHIVCNIPISVNTAYRNVPKVGRVKTEKYKAYAAHVAQVLGEEGKGLYIGRKVRWKMFLLVGAGDNRDVSNCIKVIEDILADHFGLNDALNDMPHAERIDNKQWPGWRGRCAVVLEVEDDQDTDVRQVKGAAPARVPARADQPGRRRRKPHRDGGHPPADHGGAGQS